MSATHIRLHNCTSISVNREIITTTQGLNTYAIATISIMDKESNNLEIVLFSDDLTFCEKLDSKAHEFLMGERDGADALHEAEKQMHERTKADCMALAMRLMDEDEDSLAPETREVMNRWRPKCMAMFEAQS